MKELIELALQGEMGAHLQDNKLEYIQNRPNGKSSKTIKTASGSFDLETPRGHYCSFEPQLI